jgi:hypothetical protein
MTFNHSPPPTVTSFFSLAREIRDQIYHHLFANTVYHILSRNHVINISYGDASHHQHTFPAWLLFNKTILSEGLDQFAQHAACTSIIPFSPSNTTDPGCAFLIHHDTLILPAVRTVSLDLSSNCQFFGNHPLKSADDNDAFFCLVPRNNAMDRHGQGFPHRLHHIPFDISARDYLPFLHHIRLKIHVETVGWNASPSGVMLSALAALKTLGVGHKSVRIELTPPALQSMQGGVLSVAVIAAAWPSLQSLLQYVGWMLTRGFDGNASVDAKKAVDEKYQNRETWMPVKKASIGEEEDAQRRFEELDVRGRMRVVREWVSEETGSWYCEIGQGTEELKVQPVSRARGIVAFTAPKLDPDSCAFVEGTQGNVFRKDEVTMRGLVSYSCASTGELYWIEDETDGVTGYMRKDGDESFHRATHTGGFLALHKA